MICLGCKNVTVSQAFALLPHDQIVFYPDEERRRLNFPRM